MVNVREKLREATRESHRQLDEFVGTLEPFSTKQGYQAYLVAMHGMYDRFIDCVAWTSEQAGIDSNVETLQSQIVTELGFAPTPIAPYWDSPTPEQRWAAAYVLEGSAMGARYMVKSNQSDSNIASSPESSSGEASSTNSPPDPQPRYHYLEKLAADSYERWPRFVKALDTFSGDCDKLCLEAIGIFDITKIAFSTAAKPNPSI